MRARPLRNEGGMALVLTVMIVAALTVVVTDLFYESWMESALAGGYRDGVKAYYAARSGQEAAKMILVEDARKNIPLDALDEQWAALSIPLPIADDYAFFSIRDESGKINLNQLITARGYPDERWVAIFARLLDRLELDPALAAAVIDWIDENQDIYPGGAEDGYYMSLEKPYRAKNARLDSLDELARIRGFGPEQLARLRPHVSLWSSGKLNVNTASAEALMALDDGMTERMAADIIKARTAKPFSKREDVRRVPGLEAVYPNIALSIDTKSEVFSVESTATIRDTTRTITAVYLRGSAGLRPLFYKVL